MFVFKVFSGSGSGRVGEDVAKTSPGEFIRQVKAETAKVVWPTRKETMQMTAYVFVFVVVMALFLWLTDKTLEWVLYDLILGWRK